jgi:imidazole glycerol-phosphate synthase subunit HisH
MSLLVVVDYGMGNLGSVAKAFEHVAAKVSDRSGKRYNVKVSSEAADIDNADRVVFPGQGAMPDCMRYLRESGLLSALLRACETKPLFGVCVGEQMLFEHSEEGNTQGLGVLKGCVKKFSGLSHSGALKVPHMGWNQVHQSRSHPLYANIPDQSYFYFVHSFYVSAQDDRQSVGQSDYGERFTCAVARDNIFATQFHPEKSAAVGLQLYENFLSWQP